MNIRFITCSPFVCQQVRGMCGNMNGQLDDDFTAKNGIIQSLTSFAQSWKHTPCISPEPTMVSIQPCNMNSWNKNEAEEKCEFVGDRVVFGDCVDAVDIKPFRKNCVYDMCAREDGLNYTPLCLWLGALSHHCRLAGVEVIWHTHTSLQTICAGINILT